MTILQGCHSKLDIMHDAFMPVRVSVCVFECECECVRTPTPPLSPSLTPA